jgi:hypothetical protein
MDDADVTSRRSREDFKLRLKNTVFPSENAK